MPETLDTNVTIALLIESQKNTSAQMREHAEQISKILEAANAQLVSVELLKASHSACQKRVEVDIDYLYSKVNNAATQIEVVKTQVDGIEKDSERRSMLSGGMAGSLITGIVEITKYLFK